MKATSNAPALAGPPRRRRALDAALCFGVLAASFLYAPYAHDGPVLCPLRLVTGIPCPACGLTRSFCALASGRPVEAFAHHLLGPPAFLAVAILGLAWGFEAASGRRVLWLRRVAWSRTIAWTLAAVLVAYHAVRLVHGAMTGDLAAAMWASWGGRLVAWLMGG